MPILCHINIFICVRSHREYKLYSYPRGIYPSCQICSQVQVLCSPSLLALMTRFTTMKCSLPLCVIWFLGKTKYAA